MVNPTWNAADDDRAVRSRGLPVHPGAAARLPPLRARRRLRLGPPRRAADGRGHRAGRRARSSTRPTTSTGCCSSTSSTPRRGARRWREIRQAPVVRPRPRRRRSRPARTRSSAGPLRRAPRLRGHPRARPARPARPARERRGTRSSASSPARTPRSGGRSSPQRSPVGALADEAGVPVLTPVKASEPAFLDAAARARARLLPRGGLRQPAAPRGPRRPRARLGEPALLPAARPGGAPRRCRPRSAPATRSPGRARSRSRRAWTPGPVYGTVTEEIGRHDTAGMLLARLADVGRGPAGAHPRRHRRRHAVARAPARRRRLLRPQGHRRRRPRRLDPPGARRRPADPRGDARPRGRGRRSATPGSSSAPC